MKHPHLPQYFAIKRDENNPLWFEFVEWINKIQPLRFVTWEYIGIDKNGCQGSDVFGNFRPNPVTLITLSECKNAIDKTEDMKETEFKPGEYCRFENYEIQGILDLLRENGFPVYRTHNKANSDLIGPDENCVGMNAITEKFNHLNVDNPNSFIYELTREQFLFKATRGKGTIKESLIVQPGFDPKLPFEISANGKHFHKPFDGDYVCFDSKRNVHVLYSESEKEYFETPYIRNIEPFHAGMLEVGEWMEITESGPNENWVVQKMQNTYLYCPEYAAVIVKDGIKGRRVKVNITTEEI